MHTCTYLPACTNQNLHDGNNGVQGSCLLSNWRLIASVLESRSGKLLFKASRMFSRYLSITFSKVSSEVNSMTFLISLKHSLER